VEGGDRMNEQLALLYHELVKSRAALHDIAQSTARYAGLSIAASPSGTLGAPPLQEGALMVYVTNLNELTAGGGSGLGAFIEGLFGGVGRFIGGFFGGLAGGAVGAVLQPFELYLVARVADTIARITPDVKWIVAEVTKLRDAGATPPTDPEDAPRKDAQGTPTQSLNGMEIATQLLKTAVEGTPGTLKSFEPWIVMLREVTTIVKGLVVLIPLFVGAFATFLLRLTDIQAAIVGVLAFGIENALVLRGVILVTVLETVALVAELAARVVGIVGSAVDGILASVFRAVGAAIKGVLTAVLVLSSGLKSVIDPVMDWLRNGLGSFLGWLGNTELFRLVIHLVNQLPALLPAILAILDKSLRDSDANVLRNAAEHRVAGPDELPAGVKTLDVVPFPAGGIASQPQALEAIDKAMANAADTVRAESNRSTGLTQQALRELAAASRSPLTSDETNRRLTEGRELAEKQASALVTSLQPVKRAFENQRPDESLVAIAGAYEKWVKEGGLHLLVGEITTVFKRNADAPDGARSLPGQAVIAAADAPREAVEIAELVVEIAAPAAHARRALAPAQPVPEHMRKNDIRRRGVDPAHYDDH
jgi:hypothetical protein